MKTQAERIAAAKALAARAALIMAQRQAFAFRLAALAALDTRTGRVWE